MTFPGNVTLINQPKHLFLHHRPETKLFHTVRYPTRDSFFGALSSWCYQMCVGFGLSWTSARCSFLRCAFLWKNPFLQEGQGNVSGPETTNNPECSSVCVQLCAQLFTCTCTCTWCQTKMKPNSQIYILYSMIRRRSRGAEFPPTKSWAANHDGDLVFMTSPDWLTPNWWVKWARVNAMRKDFYLTCNLLTWRGRSFMSYTATRHQGAKTFHWTTSAITRVLFPESERDV